ncbi:MAG: hypothetical protein ACOX9R_18855 [Armatimonadota bacterium]
MRRAGVPVAAALLAGVVLLAGCGDPERAEVDLQVEQRVAASQAGLTLDRARGIVAEVTAIDAAEVTVMHRSVEGSTAMILAAVPAAEGMLYEEARSPVLPESVTKPTIEAVDIRWDLQADLPTLILWSERLQFSPRRRGTEEDAERLARELLERWVPDEAGEIGPLHVQTLEVPIHVVTWTGMVDGHMTGDQAVAQVSSATGLPISFSQRIALQRPSPDEIEITRDEALEIVRAYLAEEGVPGAERIDLVAQLSLSAAAHPEAGPAWLVAVIGPGGWQDRVLLVDAMSGEVLARRGGEEQREDEDG